MVSFLSDVVTGGEGGGVYRSGWFNQVRLTDFVRKNQVVSGGDRWDQKGSGGVRRGQEGSARVS
jgi:hypothetical protein